MARRRPVVLLLLLLLIAGAGGTLPLLISRSPSAPRSGGPHGIERRAATPATGPSVHTDPPPAVVAPADVVLRVLRAKDEAPIPGARVSLVDLASVWSGVADGRGEVPFAGVESGTCEIRVVADGQGEARRSVVLRRGENPAVVFLLGESPTIEGRVVSSRDGAPVPGAEVVMGTWFQSSATANASHSASTDETGAFRLRAGTAGEDAVIEVRARGFAPAERRVSLPSNVEAATTLEVALDPACVLRGVVRTSEGGPAVNARVLAFPASAEARPMDWNLLYRGQAVASPTRAETDAEGSYSMDVLAAGGLYFVSAMSPGHAPSEEREVFLPPGASEIHEDFTLRPGGAVLVEWASDGPESKLSGQVTIRKRDARDVVAFDTGLGSLRIGDLPAGAYETVVECGSLTGTAPFEITPGETATAKVRLADRASTAEPEKAGEASIEGMVTDPSGGPIAGATVSAIPKGAEWSKPSANHSSSFASRGLIMGTLMMEVPGKGPVRIARAVSSGAEGRFRIEHLNAGEAYRLSASTPASFVLPGEPMTAPATGAVLVLSPLARAKGRLVLPSGAKTPRHLNLMAGGSEADARIGTAASGGFGQGDFQTMDLVPGRQVIFGSAGEFILAPREIELRPGETLDLGDLPLERGLRIRGRVVDSAGKPVSGAFVSLDRPFRQRASTGNDGAFDLGPALAGRTVLLLVAGSGGLVVRRTVDVPADGVVGDLVLTHGGNLRVCALRADGRPCVGTVEVSGESAARGRTDHLGRWETALTPGEYQVKIQGAVVPATLVEGAETRVDIRVGK